MYGHDHFTHVDFKAAEDYLQSLGLESPTLLHTNGSRVQFTKSGIHACRKSFEELPTFQDAYDEAMEHLRGLKKDDVVVDKWSHLQAADPFGVVLPDGRVANISRFAAKQLSQKLLPKGFQFTPQNLSWSPMLAVDLLEEAFRRGDSTIKTGLPMLRIIEHGDRWRVRAVVTDQYTRVDDIEVLQNLKRGLESMNGEGVGPLSEARAEIKIGEMMTTVKVYWPFTTEDKELKSVEGAAAVGLRVRTSEIGYSSLTICPSLLIDFCTNAMTSPLVVASRKIKHIGQTERIVSNFQNSIVSSSQGLAPFVQAWLGATDERDIINEVSGAQAVRVLGRQYGLNKGQIDKAVEVYNRDPMPTYTGISAAITEAAHTSHYSLFPEDENLMEEVGGRIVVHVEQNDRLLQSWLHKEQDRIQAEERLRPPDMVAVPARVAPAPQETGHRQIELD